MAGKSGEEGKNQSRSHDRKGESGVALLGKKSAGIERKGGKITEDDPMMRLQKLVNPLRKDHKTDQKGQRAQTAEPINADGRLEIP